MHPALIVVADFSIKLKIIIPVRGRKQLKSRSSLIAVLIVIKNHNPHKGTETLLRASNIPHLQVIKNHNLRKETETLPLCYICLAQCRKIKNHNPRKGTETADILSNIIKFNTN